MELLDEGGGAGQGDGPALDDGFFEPGDFGLGRGKVSKCVWVCVCA